MTDQERAQHVYDLLNATIQEIQGDGLPTKIILSVLRDIQADMVILGAEPVVKEAPNVDWSYPVIPQGRTR